MRTAVLVLAAALVATAASAADKMDRVQGSSAVKWGPAPPSLPKGAQVAVLSGDPGKDGPFVIRLKLPANYQVPAHHHPTAESVTVLSGSFHAGMGDKLDKKKSLEFKPGGFAQLPANMNHFAWTTADTVIQINSSGPFEIIYVNAADDPRKTQ